MNLKCYSRNVVFCLLPWLQWCVLSDGKEKMVLYDWKEKMFYYFTKNTVCTCIFSFVEKSFWLVIWDHNQLWSLVLSRTYYEKKRKIKREFTCLKFNLNFMSNGDWELMCPTHPTPPPKKKRLSSCKIVNWKIPGQSFVIYRFGTLVSYIFILYTDNACADRISH